MQNRSTRETPGGTTEIVIPFIVERVDEILDSQVSQIYKDQPLAQDWARVAKIAEEIGEAVAELILHTGQNPRKGSDPDAFMRMLNELADCAMTPIYAIQHFTKDISLTRTVMRNAQDKHYVRLRNAPPA